MRFGVLGALRLVVAGRVTPIASARQRAVLSVLLSSANQTVSIPRMIDAVWGERPASSAQGLVYTYVWRLRELLVEDGVARLGTEPSGYLLRVEPGELDLVEFERLADEGKAALAAGEPARAAELLRAALELWRGEPFADVTLHGAGPAAEIHRLNEIRAAAWEERVDADLALGRHEALIGELRRFVQQHPLRERVAGQLMLACYRAGRQADALAAYDRIRTLLAAELGMDPGRELRALHQGVLRADPALLGAGAGAGDARRSWKQVAPRQLPGVPKHFAGRARELDALTALVDGGQSGGTVVISAIDGAAGIGKTTLALYWGHRNLARFPDGQLYVNLRGFTADARPTAPVEAIRTLLDALAVPADRIPHGLDAQEALYRSLLADKRMLVVLDNARDSGQVRPLLPGSPTCLTLVTSRNPLTGLIAAEHARPVTLDLLSPAEARELLAQRLGAGRVAAEAEAVGTLIELCARLPLALGIAAARATVDPALSVADLVAELHDVRDRLDVLDIGDSTTDLRAVFLTSYQDLTASAAALFRLLGLHSGPAVTVSAAASLAGVDPRAARRHLGELTRAHLLAEPAPGHYAFHDLLRAYAIEQAGAHDSPDGRRAALHRVLDHYLHSAHAAARLASPSRAEIPLAAPRPGTVAEAFPDDRSARDWLDAERAVLLAAVAQAAADGFDAEACLLSWVLANYLDQRGYWHDYFTTQRTALAAAERLGDLSEQARTHRFLAGADARLGAFEDAHAHLHRSLELHLRLGDDPGQAHTRLAIGSVLNRQGRHRDSLDHVQQALKLYEACDHRAGQADALNAIGWLHSQLGDHQQALIHCRRALDLHRALGDRFGEAHTGDSLGYAHHCLGRHAEALACYEDALNLYRRVGDRYSQSATLTRIGDTHHATGDLKAAHAARRQALAILDELQHPDASRLREKLREGR